jgi:hypothetical protein
MMDHLCNFRTSCDSELPAKASPCPRAPRNGVCRGGDALAHDVYSGGARRLAACTRCMAPKACSRSSIRSFTSSSPMCRRRVAPKPSPYWCAPRPLSGAAPCFRTEAGASPPVRLGRGRALAGHSGQSAYACSGQPAPLASERVRLSTRPQRALLAGKRVRRCAAAAQRGTRLRARTEKRPAMARRTGLPRCCTGG